MKREWTIRAENFENDQEFADQVHGSLSELASILLRLGGVGGVAPHRVQLDDGNYYVDRVVFKYDSYAPGLNVPSGAVENTNSAEAAEPEPEEVAAG